MALIPEIPCGPESRSGVQTIRGVAVYNHDDGPDEHGIPDEPRCGPTMTLNLITRQVDCEDTRDGRKWCVLETEVDPTYEGSYGYKESVYHAAHVDKVQFGSDSSFAEPPRNVVVQRHGGRTTYRFQERERWTDPDRGTRGFMRCEMGHNLEMGGGRDPTYLPRGRYLHHDHFILRCWEQEERLGFGHAVDALSEALRKAKARRR